ncbi:hypothetical protein [Nocardia iowensis]|uniref:DUF2974 domain-containing protein n=1 Tax=Nocardia iowensis TaxID=204891 RepID=A0ABX8RSG6_NOCIO|nr:hypothetical protein [Nocardia iowensis]QXN91380.1 hypothetical protein KV110_39760 [Nocardia iowensis]
MPGLIKPVSLERGLGAPDPQTEEERNRRNEADREYWRQRAEQGRQMSPEAVPPQGPAANAAPAGPQSVPTTTVPSPPAAQPDQTVKDKPAADKPADNPQPTIPIEGPADRRALEGLQPGQSRVLPSGVTATAGPDGTTSFATVDPNTGHVTTKTFDKYGSWVATAEADLVAGTGGLSRDTTITDRHGVSKVRSVDDGYGNIVTWTANPDGSHSVQYANGLIVKEPAPGSATRPEVVQLSPDGLGGVFATVDADGNPVIGEFQPSRFGPPLTRIIDPDDPEGQRTKAWILAVPGPNGISSIVEDENGVTVIDPDGTRTPVNSRFIAPPRRTHANEMFDASLGRWVPAPPATPAGLQPDKSAPAWVYATGPAELINRLGTTEVRLPQGGSDGGDRPWTDVRILDAAGRELAHYSEWGNGNKTYRLGLDHTVTIGPDGNVIDPKHIDRSPLFNIRDYHKADGSIVFTESNTLGVDLPRIALPPGVPGKGLYAYGDRLIIQTNDGEFHWVDPTPEAPTTVLPAERSIHRPWNYRDAAGNPAPAFQDSDGNHHFNVNGQEVVFSPDQRQVIDQPNSLRPSGTGGLYIDDRGPGGFNIGVKRLQVPPGVPAIGLWELDDGRLVIQDRFGGNHYVAPIPAPAPQSLGGALSGLALSLAGTVGPRGGANRPKIDTLPRPTNVNTEGWFGPGKPAVTTPTKPTLAEQFRGWLPSNGGGRVGDEAVGPVKPSPQERVGTSRVPDRQNPLLQVETRVRAEETTVGPPRPRVNARTSSEEPQQSGPAQPPRPPGNDTNGGSAGGDGGGPRGPRVGGHGGADGELPWRRVITYARLAKDVYNTVSTARIGGYKRVQVEELATTRAKPKYFNTNSGLVAALYRNRRGDLVLAFKGTTPTKMADLKADAQQATKGETDMYDDAITLANRVRKSYPRSNLVIVGHSLGGGLGGVSILATVGTKGITFNAAGVHNNYIRLLTGRDPAEVRTELAETGRILNYVVKGELLTGSQEGQKVARTIRFLQGRYGPEAFPEALGRTIILEPEPGMWSLKRHLMDSVLTALYRYLEDGNDGDS